MVFFYEASSTAGVYEDAIRRGAVRYPLRSSGNSDYALPAYGDEDSISDRLHRPTSIQAVGTGVSGHANGQETFTYSYNGAGRLAGLSSDKSYVNLKTSSTTGTYDAFDRFGRTLSQAWTKVSPTSTILDQVDYAYDSAGSRLTRDVVTSTNNTRDQSTPTMVSTGCSATTRGLFPAARSLARTRRGTGNSTSSATGPSCGRGSPVREQAPRLNR